MTETEKKNKITQSRSFNYFVMVEAHDSELCYTLPPKKYSILLARIMNVMGVMVLWKKSTNSLVQNCI
jgi:hypothetical protein